MRSQPQTIAPVAPQVKSRARSSDSMFADGDAAARVAIVARVVVAGLKICMVLSYRGLRENGRKLGARQELGNLCGLWRPMFGLN